MSTNKKFNGQKPVKNGKIQHKPGTCPTSTTKTSIEEEIPPVPELISVCERSVEVLKNNKSYKKSLGTQLEIHFKSAPIKGVNTCGGAYASRSNGNPTISSDLSGSSLAKFNDGKITPRFLKELYLETEMKQNIIDMHLQPEKEDKTKEEDVKKIAEATKNADTTKKAETTKKIDSIEEEGGNKEADANKGKTSGGKSASKWMFDNLIDLSCIPLLNLDLEAIIPHDFKASNGKVEQRIKDSLEVKNALNELSEASWKDLALFSGSKKMNGFLGNPWCLCFTLLRDLLTRNDAEVRPKTWETIRVEQARNPEKPKVDVTLEQESYYRDEDKAENSSEQLLHRFMEVILLLFSFISESRDELRSTPGRVKEKIEICNRKCEILDDGYVYMTRGGTTPRPTTDWEEGKNRRRPWNYIKDSPSDRNRYGWVPVIRYEAKRLEIVSGQSGDSKCQIFSELLSAAIINMRYADENDASSKLAYLPTEVTNIPAEPINHKSTSYHDAFVISIRHYKLSIHTARFPLSYLKWVTTSMDTKECPEKYFILYKVTGEYDLSKPESRKQAAKDILVLLWAIKFGDKSASQGVYVARARMSPKLIDLRLVGQNLESRIVMEPLEKKTTKRTNADRKAQVTGGGG